MPTNTVNSFYSGDTVRFSIAFTVGTTDTDPTGVIFRTKNPNGVVSSYTYGTDAEVIKVSQGNYRVDLALSLLGEYNYRWEGTGNTAPGVSEGRIKINRSNVIM